MRLPPLLLEEHQRRLRVLLVIVLPALYGAVTGYLLGVSEGAYLVLSILGVLGGIGAASTTSAPRPARSEVLASPPPAAAGAGHPPCPQRPGAGPEAPGVGIPIPRFPR